MKLLRTLAAGVAGTLLVLAMPAQAFTPPQQTGGSTAIMLQGFHWNSASYASPNWYNTLQNNAGDIKNMGFTHVWFPPPSDAGSTQGYLPRQLNLLNSSYGSANDLTNAVHAFTNNGVKAVVDVVINHRVGTTGWSDFTNPSWSRYAITRDDECNCGLGNADTGSGYSAARDLDHSNAGEVQNGIKNWLNTVLKPIGFSGIRFDFVKGYAPTYAGQYSAAFNAESCVGELWNSLDLNNVDAHRQDIMNWINGNGGSCGAFDFTTKGLLNDALSNNNYWRLKDSAGKPAGALGWWPAMSVTFVDNHDTGPAESCSSGQNLWAVPCGAIMQGYAYILTHPGIPTVFYPHVYNFGLKGAIQPLMTARKAAGVTSTSAVSIQQATTGLYAAIVSGNAHQLAMKIGPNSWSPGAGWTLQASGNNYAVWMK